MADTTTRTVRAIRNEMTLLGERHAELLRELKEAEQKRHLIRCQMRWCGLALLEITPIREYLVLDAAATLRFEQGLRSFVVTCPSCGTKRAVIIGAPAPQED